ncbi:survival motor neuron isoform X3, partial [Brachionus plicatilis]
MAKSNNNVVLFNINDKSEDVWDDRALIRAYDQSISRIKQELVKKMECPEKKLASDDLDLDEEEEEDEFEEENEYDQENEGYYDEDEENEVDLIKFNEKDLKKNLKNWSIGDLCMAIFNEDGLLYPAEIIKIINNGDVSKEKCVVKFLYYLNEEEKYLDELYEYIGTNDKKIESEKKQPNLTNVPSEENSSRISFPNFQIPPPPLPDKISNKEKSITSEQDALHSMLLSWYMNGYHTGYYLGLTENKNNS